MKKFSKKEIEIGQQFLRTGKYYPTHTVGSGKWTHNYTSAVGLSTFGLESGKHYTWGNDAPRGGACGDFQKLTAAGKRLKIIKELFAAAAAKNAEIAQKDAARAAEYVEKLHADALEDDKVFELQKGISDEVKAEILRVKKAHEAPTPVLAAAKQASGLSWKHFFKLV
jgi:hypothetical protein